MNRRDLYLEYRRRQIPAAIAWDFAKRGLACDRENLAKARREAVRILANDFVRAAEYAADVRFGRIDARKLFNSMEVQAAAHALRQRRIEEELERITARRLGVHPDLLR